MKKSTRHFTTNLKPMVVLIRKCPERWMEGGKLTWQGYERITSVVSVSHVVALLAGMQIQQTRQCAVEKHDVSGTKINMGLKNTESL
jgi:hypothetical protein